MKLRQLLITGLALFAGGISSQGQGNTILVNADHPAAEVQPTMWGVFFEDINLGADGGIYAEMVKNRSFEFYKPMMGWKVHQSRWTEGSVLVMNRKEASAANP